MKQGKSCVTDTALKRKNAKTPPANLKKKYGKDRKDEGAWSDFSSGNKSESKIKNLKKLERWKNKRRIQRQLNKTMAPDLLNEIQSHILAVHSESQREKLDLDSLDIRFTIEKHTQIKKRVKYLGTWREFKKSKLRARTMTPIVMPSNFRTVKEWKEDEGVLQSSKSTKGLTESPLVYTNLSRRHVSPLEQLTQKRDTYLNQINKEQDELLRQLKEKDRKLALKSLKASRIFHGFVSNMEQTDMPDRESYIRL